MINQLKIYFLVVPMLLYIVRGYSQTTDTLKEHRMLPADSINIGYARQPSWMVSSALSVVKGSELEKSFTSNLGTTLFGRLSGLTVGQQKLEPGLESPTLLSRGTGTFGTGRGPLIIVDGFEGSYEQLSPYEIESITLLKDASATAIYGLQGANGVLLVTTKRGKKGPLKVDFSAQSGFNTALYRPSFLGAYEYASLYNEALSNDGKPALYTSADLDAYRNHTDPYLHPNVNWYDQVMRKTSPISNYDLNFSGGDTTIRYFALLNAISDNGLLIKSGDLSDNSNNSTYNRYNFRTNIDARLTKRISAVLTVAGSVENKANPVDNTTDDLFQSIAVLGPNAFPVYNPNHTYGGSSTRTNPLGDVLENGLFTSSSRTLQSSLKIIQDLGMITPGLNLSGAISFNNFFQNFSNKTRTYERYGISSDGADGYTYTKFGQKSSLVGNESLSNQWRKLAYQASLTYDRDFGANTLNALLLYNNEKYTVSGSEYDYKHIGVSGRLTYTWHQRYIAEGSFSYMGSENFAPGNRYGFFPALSLGWILSNEKFMANQKLVSYFKIRGSAGLTGNDNIGGDRFAFDQYYQYTSSYYFGTSNTSSSSLQEGKLANKDITWEKDLKLNIGFDLTFARTFDLSFDVFRNRRTDILVTPNSTVPGFYGIDLPYVNQGIVRNYGFEAMINYHTAANRPFQFLIGANVFYAKNKIINMAEEVRQYPYQHRTGLQVDQPFALEAIGFFRDAADINSSPKQTFEQVVPGDIKFKDQNGDGVIDVSDNVAYGNTATPSLTVGLTPGFRYKGFDFQMLIQAVTGSSTYLSGLEYYAFQNNGQVSAIAQGRWTPETAAIATYPRLSSKNNENNYQYSSFWVKNGEFIKFRSMELGYTFKNQWLNKIRVNNARLFMNGTNVFSIDHIKGSDPEYTPGYVGYPAVRTLSLGLKISL